RDLGTLRLGLRADLVADPLGDFGPIARERCGQFVARPRRPVRPLPGRRMSAVTLAPVAQTGKEPLPLGIDRGRVGLVTVVEVFEVGGVAAVEKRRAGESCVRVLARHMPHPDIGRAAGWRAPRNNMGPGRLAPFIVFSATRTLGKA